jgi:hypothetical protein
MTLSDRQRAAIRRRRREDADAAAEDRWTQRVGEVMGLGFAEPIAPAVQVGWYEKGQVHGGALYCRACAPTQPTPRHSPVFAESHYATLPCSVCGDRLDHSTV